VTKSGTHHIRDTGPERTLLLVVADGVRHDVLLEEIEAGHAPALAALSARGGYHQVATCFPSVTGPGYVPFLTGRFPAAVGVPGLRWFDRERKVGLWPAHSRSYAGVDIWHLDADLQRDVPTLFDLARPSLACMSMLGRGAQKHFGRSLASMARVAPGHFRGDLEAWRRYEQRATRAFLREFERHRPQFATLAVTSPDKRAHKEGPFSAGVRNGIIDIDAAVAHAVEIAERGGWREQLDVWVVGDHGHDPVSKHEDLHGWLETRGLHVRAHPQVFKRRADVALMVGGNAMAHLYLDPGTPSRSHWPALAGKWESLHDALLARESVGLLGVSLAPDRVRVASAANGAAEIHQRGTGRSACWDYVTTAGDPLQIGGTRRNLDYAAAYAVCATTDYPDAIVQLPALLNAPRSGDIVVSAAQHWDLRSRFEPVAHVSTHGALLRDQMMVPLIVDRAVARPPLRTADVMPSALHALGLPIPDGLDGEDFLEP
jgi:hypothetical protein